MSFRAIGFRSPSRSREDFLLTLRAQAKINSLDVPATIVMGGDRAVGEPWIPNGFHTVTPNIIADDAEAAIAFLKRAFGATEHYRLTLANGKVTHCELRLGDSIVNLGEAMEGWPARGLLAQIFVEDADALFARAVKAGAAVVTPMTDMFFGVREGRVSDPYGNTWTIATLKERVSPEEMQRRMAAEGY